VLVHAYHLYKLFTTKIRIENASLLCNAYQHYMIHNDNVTSENNAAKACGHVHIT